MHSSEKEEKASGRLNHKAKACSKQHDASLALSYSTGKLSCHFSGKEEDDRHASRKQASQPPSPLLQTKNVQFLCSSAVSPSKEHFINSNKTEFFFSRYLVGK